MPPAVAYELEHPAVLRPVVKVSHFPFLRIVTPQPPSRYPELATLDTGEAEAIALAVDLRAEAILIDEKRGRRAASRLGLTTVGVVAILVRAKQSGAIPLVVPLLDRLRAEIDFFLDEKLREWARHQAGE